MRINVANMTLVPYANLNCDQRIVAQLVYDTIPGYYGLISSDHDRRLSVILAQLEAPKTEISSTWVGLIDGKIVGYTSHYLGEEMATRQFNGVAIALGQLNRTEKATYLAALKDYQTNYPPLPPNCLYLARLAVCSHYEGAGISASLMNFSMDSFKEVGRYAGYVVSSNVRSQKFTAKFGLRKIAESSDGGIFLIFRG
jgi:predicted GNAT family N-acyltransferase